LVYFAYSNVIVVHQIEIMETTDICEEDPVYYPSNIARLLAMHKFKILSKQEKDELGKWVQKSDQNKQLFKELTSPASLVELQAKILSDKQVKDSLTRVKGKLSFVSPNISDL
jgi:hypothetical protein